jgi:hypothetical protein
MTIVRPLLAFLCLSIAACSSGTNLTETAQSGLIPSSAKPGSGTKPASTTQHRLFVSSLADNSIGVFDYQTAAQVAIITDPSLNQPAGLTVSGNNLYVTNNGNDTVSVFDVNKYTYVTTLAGNGLKSPIGIVATGGATPKLFVVNENGTSTSVFIASTGAASSQISASGSLLGAAAFGSTSTGSNLYFSGANQNVSLVDYQSLMQNGSIAQHTIDIHYGIAYGYGNVYVSNFLSNSVDVYDANTKAYSTTLTGNGLSGPCGIAVGGGRVYVANFFGGGSAISIVSQFNASTGAPISQFPIAYLAKSFYLTYY